LIPFALNESTRFISPTKTPEYLAGGVPVVSTPIQDVVHPYGEKGLVYIAQTPAEFIEGIEWGLRVTADPAWLSKVDEFLEDISWDLTWEKMMALVKNKIISKQEGKLTEKENIYV
jgi:UDP-galactopyranose mutase